MLQMSCSLGGPADKTHRKEGQQGDACTELGCAVAEKSSQLRLMQAVPAKSVVVHVQVHKAEGRGAKRGDDGEAEHPVKAAGFLYVHAAAALHSPGCCISTCMLAFCQTRSAIPSFTYILQPKHAPL